MSSSKNPRLLSYRKVYARIWCVNKKVKVLKLRIVCVLCNDNFPQSILGYLIKSRQGLYAPLYPRSLNVMRWTSLSSWAEFAMLRRLKHVIKLKQTIFPHTQITESDELILSPTRPRPGAFVKDDHGHYLVTAYFTDKPSDICKKRDRHFMANGRHKKKDALVIQMSDVRLCKPEFMEIPLDERKLANTRWVKGKCFRGMGKIIWKKWERGIAGEQ